MIYQWTKGPNPLAAVIHLSIKFICIKADRLTGYARLACETHRWVEQQNKMGTPERWHPSRVVPLFSCRKTFYHLFYNDIRELTSVTTPSLETQTDGRTLPSLASALSPCFAKATWSIINHNESSKIFLCCSILTQSNVSNEQIHKYLTTRS